MEHARVPSGLDEDRTPLFGRRGCGLGVECPQERESCLRRCRRVSTYKRMTAVLERTVKHAL